MNIRRIGVQYMRNYSERFIDSNTEDSWARCLANMSQQGKWADALVIQAVADALYLTINITESNQRFGSHTIIRVATVSEHEPIVINIGHMDEVHYVSTVPYNEEMVETDLSGSRQ